MKENYVLSTESAFFVYILVMVLLFLIGQRTQRAHMLHEIERNGASDNYYRIPSNEDLPLLSSYRINDPSDGEKEDEPNYLLERSNTANGSLSTVA